MNRLLLPSLIFGPLGLAATACTASPDAGEPDDGPPTIAAAESVPFRGVNLAGADFGEHALPGQHGVDYVYPTVDEIEYFIGKGMTTFRVPFRWERLQRVEGGALDASELARLDAVVDAATSRGGFVLLDPHNYARYHGRVVGAGLGNASFAHFWSRLATHYKNNPRVLFGLMNEPKEMPTEQWFEAANAAIAAIRAAGATNLVLVPGNAWTGAHSWLQDWYGTPNAVAALAVQDPADNIAFEVHQYLDADSSGTHVPCVDATVGSRRMQGFTAWLREHGLKGFLGEIGASSDATCLAALRDIIGHVHANSDVYLGWTYWAAGPWWGEYMYTIEPSGGADRPQLTALAEFLTGSGDGGGSDSDSGSGSGLGASLHLLSEWSSGYCAEVRIANEGSTTVESWRVELRDADAAITQAWNATLAAGPPPALRSLDAEWNRRIAPGGRVAAGFCADKTGPSPYPDVVVTP